MKTILSYVISHLISLAIITLPVLAVMYYFEVDDFRWVVFVVVASVIMALTTMAKEAIAYFVNRRHRHEQNRDTTGEES